MLGQNGGKTGGSDVLALTSVIPAGVSSAVLRCSFCPVLIYSSAAHAAAQRWRRFQLHTGRGIAPASQKVPALQRAPARPSAFPLLHACPSQRTDSSSSSAHRMADSASSSANIELDAKWDKLVDLSLRRLAFAATGAGLAGLLFFRK